MIKKNWREAFELVGLLAIVVSLVFVAFEIRQDQVLTRSELGAGSAELAVEISLAAIETGFHSSFVKMIKEPDQLSDDEIAQISLFLTAVRASFVRECYLVSRGVFDECDDWIRSNLPRYFENEFAKVWWKKNAIQTPYLPAWINDEIESLDANGNRQELSEIRAEFQ